MADLRMQQKRGLEIDWIKAKNFIPKDGEIIIYEPEQSTPSTEEALLLGREYAITYARMKIGDGSTPVNNLPFFSSEKAQITLYTWEEDD